MTGPIQEPKRISDMNSAEIAFSLYDDNRDGYVTTREMMKKSKNLTADQVDKVNGNKNVGIIIDLILFLGFPKVWYWWWRKIKFQWVQKNDG